MKCAETELEKARLRDTSSMSLSESLLLFREDGLFGLREMRTQ